MVVDDRIRLRIYEAFAELIGPEEAEALVENMVTVHDVATKADVRAVRDDMRVLSAELRGEMEKMRGELRAEIHQAVVGQTRWLIGYITAWSGVVLALAKMLF